MGPLPLRPEGFEPPTRGLEGRCSIQLSYRRACLWSINRACGRTNGSAFLRPQAIACAAGSPTALKDPPFLSGPTFGMARLELAISCSQSRRLSH